MYNLQMVPRDSGDSGGRLGDLTGNLMGGRDIIKGYNNVREVGR